MAFFKRKNAASAKGSTSGTGKAGAGISAASVSLIQSEDGSYALGFGMRWRTLLKSGGKESSIPLARSAKATHYVHLGHQVGYGIFPKNSGVDLYPAALMAAKVNAGVALFCLVLAEDQYWLCLVRNGLPTTADDILVCSQSDAVQRMRHVLDQFSDEQIVVYSDIRQSGIAGAQEFTLHDLFDVVKTASDLIQPLPKSGPKIPYPLMIAVIGGSVLLLGQKLWSEYQNNERLKQLAAMRGQDEDPQVAWAPVLRTFLSENAKPDKDSLKRVRASLAEVPVMWSGWWLTGARCQVGPMVQTARSWSCTANYKRTGAGQVSSAMSGTVKKLMPTSSVIFPSIGTMAVSWSFSVASAEMVLAEIAEPEAQTLAMLSAMQPLVPTLSISPEFKMTPIELPAPKMSDGKPYPKPPNFPELFSGQVLLRGPMRSIDFASTKLPPVDWQAIGIAFDEQASPSTKGLTASALMAELEGKVLAKKGTAQ